MLWLRASLIKTVYSGGWEGQAHFKMSFPSGGAIEVGQHIFKLATNGLYSRKCSF